MAITKYKVAIAHADTNITTTGGGTAPSKTNVLETEAGARTLTGAQQVIQDNANTGELCRVGDTVKYVNLFIEAAPRSTATTPAESMGHIEWAFVCVKETETAVPITNLGTVTLGVICNRMYRNECIWTGDFPIGLNQPNSMHAMIKIPRSKQTIRIGDEWRFIHWFRSWDSTNDDLNNVKVVKSWMFKTYS